MKDWIPPTNRKDRELITFEIDLCRIDQSRCRKRIRKTGERASFCRFVLVPSPNSPYGEWNVRQVRREGDPKWTTILGTAQVPPDCDAEDMAAKRRMSHGNAAHLADYVKARSMFAQLNRKNVKKRP